jgi:hypothetical protein
MTSSPKITPATTAASEIHNNRSIVALNLHTGIDLRWEISAADSKADSIKKELNDQSINLLEKSRAMIARNENPSSIRKYARQDVIQ